MIAGLRARYDDVWLLDGVRTPFADYGTVLGLVSPTDLGIKAARAIFQRTSVPPNEVNLVVAGNMAQSSFDAYVLPRHIGLYSGVPIDLPEPDGPMMATYSPRSISSETSRKAWIVSAPIW